MTYSPSQDCQKLQELASAYTYHGKTIGDKLKETVRSVVQRNTKDAVKIGIGYTLQHVPVVGPELEFLFQQGSSLVEKFYKTRKAESLRKEDDNGSTAHHQTLVLAELKNFSINNAMADIDKGYQKVRHSLEKIQKKTNLTDCEDFVDAFQRLYTFEENKQLLLIKIEAVQKTLELLTDELNQQQKNLLGTYQAELIALTNTYCENHFTRCDSEICIHNSKIEKMTEKSKLLHQNVE